jgi:hypothetical protein
MKKQSIKFHLSQYLIHNKRKTTINHAFASAIAPVDTYDEAILSTALRVLGQNPDEELTCVYCGAQAETWDHLVGLVEKGELRGFGHQVGNLVPCCKKCNSKKGAKDWETHLEGEVTDEIDLEMKRQLIASYLAKYATPVNLENAKAQLPDDWIRYCAIKEEIFNLMKEADELADHLRAVATKKRPLNEEPLRSVEPLIPSSSD